MIFIALVVEFVLLIEMRNRIRIFNPAEIAGWFVFISQIVYYNGNIFFYTRAPWPTYSYARHPEDGISIYFILFIVLYSSTIGIKGLKGLELSKTASQAALRAMKYEPFFLILIYATLIFHIANLKPDILWSNHEYLLLRSQEATRLNNSFGMLIAHLVLVLSIVSAAYCTTNISIRRPAMALLWGIPLFCVVILWIIDCSRSAMLILSIFLSMMLIFGRVPKIPVTIVLTPICIIAYSAALNGRIEGQFGLSALPFIIERAIYGSFDIAYIIGNTFQGIFTTSDGLDFHGEFSLKYKVLSFSPFPSAIDGFSRIREANEIRLFYYIPMSAITESIKFGPAYVALFFGTIWIAFRLSLKSANKIGLLYVGLSSFLLLEFVTCTAYPIRNVYKPILVCILISVVATHMAKRRNQARLIAQRSVEDPASFELSGSGGSEKPVGQV